MTALIETETEAQTRAFLSGQMTPEEFETWIISAIDDVAVVTEREALWEIRLLLTEYGESLRPVEDALRRSAELLRELTLPLRTDAGSDTITSFQVS
jgi:hypothetical protein